MTSDREKNGWKRRDRCETHIFSQVTRGAQGDEVIENKNGVGRTRGEDQIHLYTRPLRSSKLKHYCIIVVVFRMCFVHYQKYFIRNYIVKKDE